MLSSEEKSVILNNAITNYIFNYCYSQKNPGKVFNGQAWSIAIDEATKDPMFTLSQEAVANFSKIATNLDAYAIDPVDLNKKSEDKKELILV